MPVGLPAAALSTRHTPALAPALTRPCVSHPRAHPRAHSRALSPARSAPRSAPRSARALHARSPPRRHPARAQADEGAGRARRGDRPGGSPRCAPSTPLALDACAACNPTRTRPATTCLLPTRMRAQPAAPCGLQPWPATLLGATPALDVLDAHLAASRAAATWTGRTSRADLNREASSHRSLALFRFRLQNILLGLRRQVQA